MVPSLKKSKKNKLNVKLRIDTSYINQAIKKTDVLINKLNECIKLIHQLNRLIK